MRILAAALAAVATLALAGTASAASQFTAPQYRASANTACNKLADRAARLPAISRMQDIPTWLAAYIPLASATATEIRALDPPVALAGLHHKVVANLSKQLERSRTLLRDVRSGRARPEVVASDTQLEKLANEEIALWKRIGARVCGGA
jgi:hypothetical protein